MTGYMYILECADGSYYTGSTKNLELRIAQHQAGEGANHTRKHLPVKLVYYETYPRIDHAFYREKQVQGWSRKKKEALINGAFESLSPLSMAYRDIKKVASRASATCQPLSEANVLPEANNALPEANNSPKPNTLPEASKLPEAGTLPEACKLPKPNTLPEAKTLPEALEGNTPKTKIQKQINGLEYE